MRLNMWRKVAVGILASTMMVLAGCSSQPTSAPAASAPAAPKPAASAKKPFEGVTITHLAQAATSRPEAYRALAAKFKEETGATVNVIDAPWEQMHDKLINDFISGAGAYDAVDVDSGWDGEMALYFEPLDPYIAKSKIDMKDFLPIFQVGVGISGLTGGKRYGMPLTGQSMAMFYRKDLLAAKNIAVPTTWDGFDKAIAVDYGQGVSGFVTAGVNVQLVKLFFARYRPQGKPLFSEDFKPQFTGPEGVKAVEGMKTMFKYAPQGVMAMDNPDANQVFLNGNAVFLITWPNTIQQDLENASKSKIVGKWDVAAPPGPGNIGPWYLAVPKDSKNKDAAWAWIDYLSRTDSAKMLMTKYGNLATRASVWGDPEVVKAYAGAKGISDATGKSFWPTFILHPKGIEWFVFIGGEWSDAITGKKTADQAVKESADKWNELYAAAKSPAGLKYEELGTK